MCRGEEEEVASAEAKMRQVEESLGVAQFVAAHGKPKEG